MGLYKLTYKPQGLNDQTTVYVEADSFEDAMGKINKDSGEEVTTQEKVNITSMQAVEEEFIK